MHISGICEASGISSEEEEISFKEPTGSTTAIRSHYEEIQALVAEGSQLGAWDVLIYLFNTGNAKLTLREAEDQALMQLLLGFLWCQFYKVFTELFIKSRESNDFWAPTQKSCLFGSL